MKNKSLNNNKESSSPTRTLLWALGLVGGLGDRDDAELERESFPARRARHRLGELGAVAIGLAHVGVSRHEGGALDLVL